MPSQIESIQYYLPSISVGNEEIAMVMDGWTAEKIYKKIGIRNRFITAPNETAADLATQACLKILEKTDRMRIEALVLCTQSPDYFLPTTACILQERIGLAKNSLCFDFNLGCSGYIYGLAILQGLISAGTISGGLLVTAETYSKFIDEKDGGNRALFGDAASATFISKAQQKGIGKCVMGTDGAGYENLIVRNGGARNPEEALTRSLFMDGPAIFEFTNEAVPKLVSDTLNKNETTIDKIDYFVFHQANKYMLEHLRNRINIAPEKFLVDMEDYGNTVSSTIPIVLANKLNKEPDFFEGKTVMLVGFGVGYSWGATIIQF